MIALRPPRPRARISRRAVVSAFGLSRPFSESHARRTNYVPPLTHGNTFSKGGIPGVMSPEAFDTAWTRQQAYLVDQLNERTAGTPDEGDTTKSLLIKHARQPENAALFNYASMAHNNHFFFSGISPTPVQMPDRLRNILEKDFSSMETLKLEFLATGEAMFGPGFVWLVKSTSAGGGSKFRILSTYTAGTPYSGAHYRRQPVDMNSQSRYASGDVADIISRGVAQNDVGAMGSSSKIGKEIAPRLAPGGVDLTPALCVSTWEHAWLQDWGFGGKRAYLEAWWDKINWEIVMMNSNIFGR